MKVEITPVLLAGGSGTRLWPHSRKSYPKQFSNIIGHQTLFQAAALNFSSSEILNFKNHITMTNVDYRFIVGDQLKAAGFKPGPVLVEPISRSTHHQ